MTHDHVLERAFHPKTIAIVGVSRAEGNHPPGYTGLSFLRLLQKAGFEGRVYPINPKATVIEDVKAYPSVTSVPEPLDLVIVAVPAVLVPHVLEELAAAGIKDKQIRFIAACGCHGAMNRMDFERKLGKKVLKRFPVYNHAPYDNCVYAGTTKRGTKLYINAEVMKCDLKIGIGSIVPHIMAGFGGGSKLVLPGVAAYETIVALHSPPTIDKEAQRRHQSANPTSEENR